MPTGWLDKLDDVLDDFEQVAMSAIGLLGLTGGQQPL